MILETDRLEIIPLNGHQLKLLTEDMNQFEQEMNCQYCGEEMEGMILEFFKGQIEAVQKNSENYFWHTFWLFKLKNEGKFIGSACFKNAPYDNGQVEIGYGINKNFQNLGYTTEAVNALCKWALNQPYVTRLVAETEKDNIPSQRVLKKCNMKLFKETEECFWWELTGKSTPK
jgi:ribosomal-protein-alanine N-acetyltransferase